MVNCSNLFCQNALWEQIGVPGINQGLLVERFRSLFTYSNCYKSAAGIEPVISEIISHYYSAHSPLGVFFSGRSHQVCSLILPSIIYLHNSYDITFLIMFILTHTVSFPCEVKFCPKNAPFFGCNFQ